MEGFGWTAGRRRMRPGKAFAFDAARSNRHKSGVALRFPRVARLRMDKPVQEADRLETLMRLVEPSPG